MNRYRNASNSRTRTRRLVVGSIVGLASLLIAACTTEPSRTAAPGAAAPALPAAQAIVDSQTYAHGSWNWNVVESGTGKTLYASNESKLNFLGSTTKLFTVGTYYEEFGAESTPETPVYAVGTRSGGSLSGDLVLVGSGDFILGGRGSRPADLATVKLDDCVQAVIDSADQAGFERFVLVGHSLGGVTITETAWRHPERVAQLIYVGAMVPGPGECAASVQTGADWPSGELVTIEEEIAKAISATT